MADNSRDRLTLARLFLEPSNSTHRQYEALRAFFVDGLSSAEAAARFGYTPGSFRVLVHQFRDRPGRDFFVPASHQGRPPGKQKRLRLQVVALRKQNLSVHDISRALARDGEALSPAAVAAILKEEGFAKLPRRADDERPDQPRPVAADVADVRQLDLTPRAVHTKFGGLFLFLPDLIAADLDVVLARSGLPGSNMIPPTSVRLDVCKMPANLAANQGVARPAEPQGSSVRPSPSSSVGGPATTAQPRTGTAGPDARRAVPSVVIVALRVSVCHRLGRALNSGRVGPSTWS